MDRNRRDSSKTQHICSPEGPLLHLAESTQPEAPISTSSNQQSGAATAAPGNQQSATATTSSNQQSTTATAAPMASPATGNNQQHQLTAVSSAVTHSAPPVDTVKPSSQQESAPSVTSGKLSSQQQSAPPVHQPPSVASQTFSIGMFP